MEETTTKKSSLIEKALSSEAILIAIIPFVGTYIAFLYEAGYASYYEIPISFIQIDALSIISSSTLVVLFIYAFFVLLDLARKIVKGSHPVRKALALPLTMTIVSAFFIVFLDIPNKILLISAVFLFATTITYLPPLFKRDTKDNYLKRLEIQNANENKRLKEKNPESTRRDIISPIAFLFVFGLLIFKGGIMHAEDKTYYYVLKDSPNKALVSNYGDNLIFSTFDQRTKTFTGEITFAKLDSSNPLPLIHTKTGPLKRVARNLN
ncbi:hypothetical protein [Pseudomonas aeruginosa]|uniref:hypothetical protein n=1 Tax=Pseudomonas aeruginosa TaxID=287 RepID=UPI00129859A8|nr:hypothetical protein [Pseudomonas aeruginosa]